MWRQGEHIALVGDTGSGKTYLASRLVRYRAYDVVIQTKSDDIHFAGHRRIRSAAQMAVNPNRSEARYILDPPYQRQGAEVSRAIERVWAEGGWTVVFDETWYLTQQLKLGRSLDRLLTQGRSLGLSVVCGMQRPAQISRFVLSQCTHLFAFASEGRDVQTLAEAFTPRLKEAMADLRPHEYVYFDRRSRKVSYGYTQQLGSLLGRVK